MLSSCEKHVKFAKCYLAVCIPTGEKQLKFIGPEHYREVRKIDYDSMPEKRRKRFIELEKKKYETYNTAHGMFSLLVSMSKDTSHNNIKDINPEEFLALCENVINDASPVLKHEKVFSANWNWTYKHRPFIAELKTKMSIIYEQFSDYIKEYYEKARAFQQPYKQYAQYLSKEQIDKFRNIYNEHKNGFNKQFTKIVNLMMPKEGAHEIYNEIMKLKDVAATGINKMKEYTLTADDIVSIKERIKNDNIYVLMSTCRSTFGENLPVCKVIDIVKFHIVGDDRKCELFEVLDMCKDVIKTENKKEDLLNVLRVCREYAKHSTSPLLPYFRPGNNNIMHVSYNYNI